MMSSLAEQLSVAMGPQAPTGDGGFICRLLNLSHANYPGRDAHGVLPLVVVGHEGMSESAWAKWVRQTAVPYYGSARAERFVNEGIELKEMLPSAPFGRTLRQYESKHLSYDGHYTLNRAGYILNSVEKWPSLYNLIATEMVEENLTLDEFVRRVYAMPSPKEIGTGTLSTLGDLIGRGAMLLPDY
jgi:hypothetical protein